MGEVVDLDSRRPHVVVTPRCPACGATWVAVVPVGAKKLECPQCGERETAVFAGGEPCRA